MMTNRLQALANQAELYVDLCGRPYPRAMSAEEADAAYKKYGQSIVQECVDVIQNIKPQYGDYRDQIEMAQLVYCIGQIKNHFGVEQ